METKERVLPGILGALLFSLAGGIVWFILWQLNVIAGLSGIVGVFCAIKGYGIFAKKESIKGVVIASVLAIGVLVLAWYLCIGYDYYVDLSSVDPNASLMDCLFKGADYLELADLVGMPEVRSEYVSSLVKGILFSVVACGAIIFQTIKNAKAAPAAPAAPAQPTLNGEDENN